MANGTNRATGEIRPGLFHAGIAAVVGAGAVLAALLGKDAYKLYTGEDGITEVLQILFFALAAGYAVRAWARVKGSHGPLVAAPFLVAAAGLVLLVGEEISWGQRLFGWSTPEELARVNRQDETNLHNLEGVHQAFKWVQLLIGAYGMFLPWLFREGGLLARWRGSLGLYVPSGRLVPYFAALFFWRIYRNLFPLPEANAFAIVEFNEVLELLLALAFFFFFRERGRGPVTNRRAASRPSGRSGLRLRRDAAGG